MRKSKAPIGHFFSLWALINLPAVGLAQVEFPIYPDSQLVIAIKKGDYAAIEKLARRPSIDRLYRIGIWQCETPLMYAAEKGDFRLVKLLVKHGASVNKLNEIVPSETALSAAARADLVEVVRYLLNHHAKPDRSGNNGSATALFYAKTMAMAKPLVEAGANVNATMGDFDMSVLQSVCASATPTVVEYLIKHGARVNYAQPDHRGRPLLNAVLRGDIRIVKILLKHGANPNFTAEMGSTPLQAATDAGKEEIAKLLRSQRAVK